MQKTLKRNQYAKDLKIYDRALFIFCMCSIMFERAFLFNPLILSGLFLAYKSGLKQFTLCGSFMIILASFLDVYYGLEVFLVFFVFLITNYLILRVSTHKYREYIGVGLINFFLLISIAFYSLDIENILSALIVIALEVGIIHAFNSFLKVLEDDTHCASILDSSIMFVIFGFSMMFFVNAGLLVLRFFMLLVIFTHKKETSSLSLCISFILLSILYNYSFDSLVMIFLPLVGALIISKYKELTFIILQMLTLFLVRTPIFYNAHFYQASIALVALLLVPKEVFERAKEIANRTQSLILERFLSQEVVMNQQLLYVTNYLDIVQDTTYTAIENPVLKGTNRVQNRVCRKCSHFDLCPLKNKIPELLQEKLKTNVKKQINETCLSPYKLVMELQQAFYIYIDEQSYYLDALEKQNQYRFAVRKIAEPVRQLQSFKSEEEVIKALLEKNGVSYKRINYKENGLIIIMNENNFESDKANLLNALNSTKIDRYEIVDEKYQVLLKEYVLVFMKVAMNNYDFGVVSKALIDEYNGDTYDEIKKYGCLHVLLSDGMGHGKVAMDNSRYLIKAITAQINISNNLMENIQETNNLMLLKNDVEQYATLDYLKIDFKNLKAVFLKAGSYASYIFKECEIKKVDTIGVPLGIIPSIDIITEEVVLEKNDVIVIVSDGIGEWFDDNYIKVTQFTELTSQEISRHIFSEFEKENIRNDDATIITIKII